MVLLVNGQDFGWTVHLFKSTNPKYGESYGYAQPSKSFTSSEAKLKPYPLEMDLT